MNTRGTSSAKNSKSIMLQARIKTIVNLLLIFALTLFAARARAQDEIPPSMPAGQTFTDAQLQQLVGPIALYPDPLIAVILAAATLPSQILMADRYVSAGGDPNQIAQQPWDPNVQALAHYPDVLRWMDNNLNWTTQLGEAFQDQQQEVMTAIQELRTDAYNLGNLQSTPQQTVINDNGYIEIVPADLNSIYVPQYQPDQVYYQVPYSGSSFVVFGTPFVIGPWLCGDFDWRAHHVIYWDHDHPRPVNWWHEQPQARANYLAAGHARVWNAANRPAYNQVYLADRGDYNNPAPTAPAANRPAPVERPGNRNGHDVRNSYNNNLPWTSEPNGVKPGPPAPPPNAFIDIAGTPDTQNDSDSGDQSMQIMPQFHSLGDFHADNPAPAHEGVVLPAGSGPTVGTVGVDGGGRRH